MRAIVREAGIPETSDEEAAPHWLEQRSPAAATRVIGRVEAAIDFLKDFPELGRQSVRRGVRELFVSRTPYIVHYRVSGGEIRTLTIRHGSQRPYKP